jgi:hypothetical protein
MRKFLRRFWPWRELCWHWGCWRWITYQYRCHLHQKDE